MATVFSSKKLEARGKHGTLSFGEPNKNGNIPVEAVFVLSPNQKARDKNGREIEVGGTELTWYATLTHNNRARMIESLEYTGIPSKLATQIIDNALAGAGGEVPERAGFGKHECNLDVEIDHYNKQTGKQDGPPRTRIKWVNGAGDRARTRRAPMAQMTLNFDGIDDANKEGSGSRDSGADKSDGTAPWMS